MNIAISINTSWNIYNFRRGLIRALQNEGHIIHAIAPKDEYSQRLIDELGVFYHPVEIENKGSNPIKDLKLLSAYKKIFKKISPDVILQYTIKPNIYGTIAAKQLGIPSINNVSGLGTIFINPNTITSRIGKILYRYAFQFPHKVFFQNDDDRQLFIQNKLIKPEKTDLVPGSGVNLEGFPFTPKKRGDKFIFLMIARVLYDKGAVEYAGAAKYILEKSKNVEFQLLGFHDNSRGSVSSKELNMWVEKGYVNYLGATDDVNSFIKSADCVVLPSYREGTPKTLLEALSIGRPIITTNTAGCKETVIENENGYICEVKNEKDLANIMLKMLTLSADELDNMGKKSRALAENKFSEKIVIEKYINTINGV